MAAEAERRPSGRSRPLMAQVLRIKAQHAGAILPFRVGDLSPTVFVAAGTAVVGWAAAREELEGLGPRELLLAPGLPEDVTAACRTGRPWATAVLPEPVQLEDAALPRLAARTAGGALAYVDAVYRRRPAHLRPPEPYALAGFLRLDGATRRNLELLETLGGGRPGALPWVPDQTETPMGARRLRAGGLYPPPEPAGGRTAVHAAAEGLDSQ